MLRPTPSCRSWGGMISKSLEVLKNQTHAAVTFSAVKPDTSDKTIIDFSHPDALSQIRTFSDADMGGYSKVSMEKSEDGKYAVFKGVIDVNLPPNRPDVQRSGYAAWRTQDLQRTLWSKTYWDLSNYTYLAMKVKGDGSKYFVNIQSKTIVPTDIHQHRLFLPRGQWETVYIPFKDFVRTNYGNLVEPQGDMDRTKIRSVGIGLIDRIPGPFELCIERIWATDNLPDATRDVFAEELGETESEPNSRGKTGA